MKLAQKLAVATASVALSFVMVDVHSAHADTVTYDFTLDVTSGGLKGNQYSGFFSFDDSRLTGPIRSIGNQFFAPLTDFGLNFANQTFTKADLVSFPGPGGERGVFFPTSTTPLPFPIVGIDVRTGPGLCCLSIFNTFGSSSFVAFGAPPILNSSGTATFSLRSPSQPVPEPLTCSGSVIAGGIGWLMKRKLAASQKA